MCVCVCVCVCVCAICCSSLAVVSSPPCSICHSFGVEDKHTDENDSNHRTISVWICLFLFTSCLYFCFSCSLLSLSGGFTKVANRHFHSIVYVHIYCILNMCLHSTWTKFQTPATSPQLNFTLFKHTLSAASAMSPICTEPHWRLRCTSVFVVHLYLIFVGLTCGNLRGKDHNATLRHSSVTFQNSLLPKMFDNFYCLYIWHMMLLTGWPGSSRDQDASGKAQVQSPQQPHITVK